METPVQSPVQLPIQPSVPLPFQSPAQSYARKLSKLFKEYSRKLTGYLNEVHSAKIAVQAQKQAWFQSKERQEFLTRFSPMQSALQTATREASQLAEQGAVDDPARIELKIRLAEVEGLTIAVITSITNA